MIQEFKDFINKGGVFEAAIGLVFALAFKPIIDSLVADVILPIVGAIFGVPSFADLSIGLGVTEDVVDADGTVIGTQEAAIRYGAFLDTIISFIIIAFVLFMLIKAYNRATNKVEEEAGPSEVELLTEIRDNLKQ
ncbi:MAG: large conductance mechanosensitive channel protein MscL [Acidimicrobiales bacterium]|nr:large conductance mechanosensitive channel protein MscL [Acidimicrobiales bacterium]